MPGSELISQEEIQEVLEVLEQGVLMRYNHDQERNNIWKAKRLEKELINYHNIQYAHTCASGTSADLMALIACNIGVNDEVIVTPFSFIAPVEAVLHIGAVPVFAEIDETLCLSPKSIEEKITQHTKAILLAQVFGGMAEMDAIVKLCKKHNIVLIEDAAPALGSKQNGKLAGTFGKIGCFSFDFYKIITSGEGGAIITNEKELYDTIHMYSDHGHDHLAENRGEDQHPILGFNYRMNELNAAVGLAQFRKLDKIIEQLQIRKKILQQELATLKRICFRKIFDEVGDCSTTLAFFVPSQDIALQVKGKCKQKNIAIDYFFENNFHYIKNWNHLISFRARNRIPMNLLKKIPDFTKVNLPYTNQILKKMLMIHIKNRWSIEETKKIATHLKGILQEVV